MTGPANKKLTTEILALIRIDRETHGMRTRDIASKYGLSSTTASLAIQGMDSSNVQSLRKKLTAELKAAIQSDRENQGLTIYQIARKYGLSKSTAHFAVQGCSAEKVPRRFGVPGACARYLAQPSPQQPRPNLSTTDLGESVRILAVGRMLLAGLSPFLPVRESTPIDILVLRTNGTMAKCQCRFMSPAKVGVHILSLRVLRNNGLGKRIASRYTREEVDFFLGYCADNDSFYVVPYVATKGRSELRIWVLRKPSGRNTQKSFEGTPYRNAFQIIQQMSP